MFTLFMGSEEWYYGVVAGIGVYILLRSIYGCYMSEEVAENVSSNSPKQATAPTDDDDPIAPV